MFFVNTFDLFLNKKPEYIPELIRYKDFRGKTLYYLQIKNETQEHSVNIGVSTFEKLTQIVKEFTDISEKGIEKIYV